MNKHLKYASKCYKICSKYFNKNQLLIWINLFGSLTQLKLLLELRLSHNLPIDFLKFKEINHRKKNDCKVTLEKYIIKYEYKAHKLYKEYVKSKCKGWNRPGINHDSTSLDFCIKKFGLEKGKEVYKQRCFDCGKSTRIQYFIDKGLTEDEARIALKERQTTFSLEKCIEKYGKIEGTKRWKERQIKWQNTLNSKPEEEIKRINMSKSSGKNKSFNHNLDYEIKFIQKYNSIDEAYSKEQYILDAFSENRVYTDYNGFSTTETFNKDVLGGYYETNIQTNS